MIARVVTVIDSDCVAAEPVESVTFTVNVEVPALVGVPEMVTELVVLEPKDSPAGSVPAEMDQVKGELPFALTVALYETFRLAVGSEVVAIVKCC
ncbi:MAG TPA: hypothetical protein VG322_10910 [Candidatus Acidoferrales bacterium]|nr:hypothetical protein [Candidatus Acidoferrales bacterium]